ncbi:surfactin family lipopeptide synthetase A [Clostridium cavendishii DSM 21758]|uniref:Surfactin family lipopeptide synthetase A n=1 Tax=Clostridium cavendishii DSM 21758 TaxID=1121302 RepID=A0A1M6MSX4_9CLOT|nr:non-ribosomal peptide synthetase [Clostridium cavendishii]SHJ86608.1 surfactin family lipopeptide synthetase A [Clostridium cavendishii DSM 21758]
MNKDLLLNIIESNNMYEKDREFWINQFESGTEFSRFYPDFQTSKVQTDLMRIPVTEELKNKLYILCRGSDVALFSIFFAATAYVVGKFINSKDLMVGMPMLKSEQSTQQINQILAVKMKIDNTMTIKKFLNQAVDEIKKAVKHGHYPLERILHDVGLNTNNNNYDPYRIIISSEKIHGNISEIKLVDQTIFTLVQESHGLFIQVLYNNKQYNDVSVKNWICKTALVLRQMVDLYEAPISDICWISEEEYTKLNEFNDTEKSFPSDRLVHSYFEEQTKKVPNNCALIFNNHKYTYDETNKMANQLARKLIEKGVGSNNIVAICMERSAELIISILAVLKAGAAYVPIDPMYPKHKIENILTDTQAKALIIKGPLSHAISDTFFVINLEDSYRWFSGEMENLNAQCLSTDIAYVIYTSGSTGQSKGVMIKHNSLVNRLLWMQEKYPINSTDVIMQKTTFCFDVSVWEILLWSLSGASLLLLEVGAEKDPNAIVEAIHKYKVTVIHFVPTMLQMFTATVRMNKNSYLLYELKYVFCSGEVLSANAVNDFFDLFQQKSSPKLINKYGPTEATIDVTYYECSRNDGGKNIPIGKPINNIKLYIVDLEERRQGIGAIGELYISGVGVAKGYLNRPELTKEKFIQNTHCTEEICYKTGDIARWLPDGNIEYIGRNDSQIKIRGYRIELGEIEAALTRHQQIEEAIAVVRNIVEDQKDICVYYSGQERINTEELKAHLSLYLPSYMLPARYYFIDQMPLLPNGKINRKELINIQDMDIKDVDIQHQEITLPKSSIQQSIYDIWKEVLKVECFSINTSFFSLGGDSIKAIRAISLINIQMGIELSIINLYENNNIIKLENYILNAKDIGVRESFEEANLELDKTKQMILTSDKFDILNEEMIEDFYPMSDIQLGMVLQSLKSSEGSVYHDQHIVTFFDEDFQMDIFKKSVDILCKKHPILRTKYYLTNFITHVQVVYKAVTNKVQFFCLQNISKADQMLAISEHMIKDRQNPFISLESESKNQLWRIAIFQLSYQGDYALLLSVHHSILDGWSVASFMTELTNTYVSIKEGKLLSDVGLKHSYKDYIIQQIRFDKDRSVEEFWKKELKGCKFLEFPQLQKNTRSELKEQQFMVYNLGMDKNKLIRELSIKEGVQIRSICFAAYVFMLYMTSYNTDFLVGLVENNRPLCEDGDKMLGCFLNTVPFRCVIEKEMTWRDFLKDINEKMIQLKHYGRLPTSKIIQYADNDSSNIYINNFFNYVDFHIYDQMDQKVKSVESFDVDEYYKTEIPLDFICMHTHNEFFLKVSYDLDHFTKEQINTYFDYFEKILCNMIEKTSLPASKTELLLQIYNSDDIQPYIGKQIDYMDCDVISMFQKEANKQASNVAISFKDNSITYYEVDRKSDIIADAIRKNGISKGNVVAILVDRSPEIIISMLGVLKAGCGYLPLDPEYPKSRIQYMIDNSECKVLITNEKYLTDHKMVKEVIVIEELCCINYEDRLIYLPNDMEDIAYMIYTSGSTGKPKGVIIDHSALSNFIVSMKNELPFGEGKTFLSITTISFDIFVLESLVSLCCGMEIILASREEQLDPELLATMFQKRYINFMQVTPSRLQLLLENQKILSGIGRLEAIMIGGENLSKSLAEKVKSTGNLRVFNMYGPTETTVWSTMKEITDVSHVSIGKPITNTELCIVDQNNELQPPEVIGELCIAGRGLARGYYNDQNLTYEKFIKHPIDYTKKIYKTGDFVRQLKNNDLVFEGRLDNQVKIRGFRIELGEIENALIMKCSVKDVIVKSIKSDEGEVSLFAFYIHDEPISPEVLRGNLQEILPNYMIPEHFVFISQFPLMTNGKIDYKELFSMVKKQRVAREIIPPKTDTEKIVLAIWKDILNKEVISTTDNFFALGGNSFLIVKVLSRVTAELSNKVTVADLFIHSTIIELSHFIDKQNLPAVRNEFKLKGVKLLEEYHVKNNIMGNRTMLIANLEEDIYIKLRKQKYDSFKEIDIALIVSYIYLLHEVSTSREVTIYVSDKTRIIDISVNFEEIESIKQLSDVIIEQLVGQHNKEFTNKTLQRTQKKNKIIISLFSSRENIQLNRVDENVFDISLTYKYKKNELMLSLGFSTDVLLKEKMEKFLNGYVQLLNIIVLELQNGDE